MARGERTAVSAALLALLLASCTSTGAPDLTAGMPAYNSTSTAVATTTSEQALASPDSAPQMVMDAEGEAALPDQVASLPSANPNSAFTISAPDGAQSIAGNTPQTLVPPGQTEEQTAQAAQKVAAGNAAALASSSNSPAAEATQVATAAPAMDNQVYVTAGAPQDEAVAPKKKGFLAAFFGGSQAKAAPSPIVQRNQTQQAAKPIIDTNAAQPAKPIVQLASAESDETPLALASVGDDDVQSGPMTSLPGVRQTALFEIKRKSGVDDESDIDLNEDEASGPINIASAAGLARLAPNGLLKQTESVDIACLKPSLVRVLKTIEGHYGKKLIVTSGYRDPNRNRRARGAKNSLHMYCAAADIQVPGVSKWELANYARSMPGRGGVGTYCHTESVHVDVGPERDWNWRCRRRK